MFPSTPIVQHNVLCVGANGKVPRATARLGLLNTAVAAYDYLRILVVMYMKDPGESTADLPPLAPGTRTVLWTCAAATLVLGIFPSLVLQFAGLGK